MPNWHGNAPHACARVELKRCRLAMPQGVRDGSGNLRCWVDADLAAAAPGAAQGVDMTLHLRNAGPYPLTQAWRVVVACNSSSSAASGLRLPLGATYVANHMSWCMLTSVCYAGSPGTAMQAAYPLGGLAVGHAWRQHLLYDGPWVGSIEVSVHLCHALPKVRCS